VLEGQAVEILHGDEGLAVFLTNVVDGTDVGMVEGRRRFGFAAKALERLAILSNVFRKEFEGDEAIEAGVFGLIDDAHAATTQLFNNAVVGNSLADHGRKANIWRLILGG
jgi:hypothetical protein